VTAFRVDLSSPWLGGRGPITKRRSGATEFRFTDCRNALTSRQTAPLVRLARNTPL